MFAVAVSQRIQPTFLTQPWWQGIAGIAQIIAAVLTIVAVYLALKTLRQSEKSRIEAISPSWDVFLCQLAGTASTPEGNPVSYSYTVGFFNSGYGSATDVSVNYVPFNGNEAIIGQLFPNDTRLILSQRPLSFGVTWYHGRPLEGILEIISRTKAGQVKHQFRVVPMKDSQEGYFDLKRLDGSR